jgi:dynamin 1-like protein
VAELRTRIDAYFAIVLRNVKDSIPKAIGYFLVRKSQDVL